MECDPCKGTIEAGDEREMHGRILCEDCFMAALRHMEKIRAELREGEKWIRL